LVHKPRSHPQVPLQAESLTPRPSSLSPTSVSSSKAHGAAPSQQPMVPSPLAAFLQALRRLEHAASDSVLRYRSSTYPTAERSPQSSRSIARRRSSKKS